MIGECILVQPLKTQSTSAYSLLYMDEEVLAVRIRNITENRGPVSSGCDARVRHLQELGEQS